MLIDVTDAGDPRLVDYVGLRDAQLRRPEVSRFIAEGVKIIERAFAAGCTPRSLLLQPRWLPGLRELIDAWPDVPVYLASEALIERVSGFHVHRGALGSFDRPQETGWDELLGGRRLIVCEDTVDHANLGKITRLGLRCTHDSHHPSTAPRPDLRPCIPRRYRPRGVRRAPGARL